MPRKFVIIDGSSLVHRAFYALPLLTTAAGQYTNAVYGFTTMLVKLLGDVKPDAMAVAFDKSRVTFRNEIYAEYKAHRKATPSELSEQIPLVQEVVQAFGITTIETAGYEADDIIGTLSCLAGEKGYDVIIVTGDRDAFQLINSSTHVFLIRKGISDMEMFDREALIAQYGISPEQVVDLKGLMGDASDNIPGVPGIGEKTATKLVQEFGSVETLLDSLDKVNGKKMQQALRENRELAILSKKLATIECNVPLDFNEKNFEMNPDVAKVREVFSRFAFKSLLEKVPVIFPGSAPGSCPAAAPIIEAKTVVKYQEVQEVIRQIQIKAELICCGVITGQVPAADLKGLAVAVNGQGYYIPNEAEGWQEVLALLQDQSIRKVTYNAKLLASACLTSSTALAGLSFDISLAAYLLDPIASTYPLDQLAEKYLGQAAGLPEKGGSLNPAFAARAAEITGLLYPVMEKHLKEMSLDQLFYEVELPLVEVLAAMEFAGIKVDKGRLHGMSGEIALKVDQLLADIYQIAGKEFNVNSTKQLGYILFEQLGLPAQKKTKTGYSTDAEVLEKLAGEHPLIDKLLEYRLLTKLKSTYLDGLAGLINQDTGRVHTTFNQTVTATGRLSSSEPNLQNIPIRTEIGRKIRELFVPDQGYDLLLSADYSQIELRILAHMSGDASLIEAFRANKDVHTATAAEVFGVPESEVSPQMRSRAKAVNFGIVYGISDYGLSRDIGVSRKEAGIYINSYFTRYPGVKNYIDRMVADARKTGYVTTLFGRRRYLPEIHSANFNQRSFAERTAMNTPIQGTAADIIKKAMVEVYRRLKETAMRSRILLQVHDELVLEVLEEEKPRVIDLLRQAMEGAVSLAIPLTTDIKTGRNWAESK